MPEISDREFGHVAWTREEVLSRVGVVIAVGQVSIIFGFKRAL